MNSKIKDAVLTMKYILNSLSDEHQLPYDVVNDIKRFISENEISKEKINLDIDVKFNCGMCGLNDPNGYQGVLGWICQSCSGI